MLSWTPALRVGVAELDAQHQELFRRADAFLEALDRRSAAEVASLLAFLGEHARAHFAAEERWMEAAGYAGVAAHRAEHQAFVAQLAAFGAAAPGEGPGAAEVATWLVRWLHEHVVRADTEAARDVLARRRA